MADPPLTPERISANTTKVIECSSDDSHSGIIILDPTHGNFVDAQSIPPHKNQEFSVEEPTIILDPRDQVSGTLARIALKPH